jgi:hypothetical protein
MYKRFLKQGNMESLALLYANGAVALLFFFTLIGILNVYCLYLGIEPLSVLKSFGKMKAFSCYFTIFSVNYFLIYYKKRHVKFFDDVYHKGKKNVYSDILFSIYLWGSYLAVAITFFIIEYKKYGYISF